MPKESNLEFKVGLFVLVSLAGLVIFIFSVGDSSVLEKGKSIRVVFGFANGLKKNAPVRIAGVDEGIVKNIELFFEPNDRKTKVKVDLWVKEGTMIPVDSVVTVNQLGMMGEKYIEIFPGTDTQGFFEEGKVYMGKNPISQAEISDRVMEVSNQLENAVSGINRLVSDERNIESFGTTLENLSLLTGNLDDIIYNASEGKGTIGKFLYDDRFYEDLEGMAADLKENPWKLLYRPKKSRSKK
jgi:phospholipid/cholesterol/gamma-HCH transport system substrate-binding protein